MSNCSFSIQILPLKADEETILKVVDEAISVLKSSNLKIHVAPFETTVEGDYEECMALLKECITQSSLIYSDIFANIKFHFNSNGEILTIEDKIKKYS